MSSQRPNILVIRLGLLGDMVCTTPMLEAIKKHFPEGRLCLLSNEYNRPVVARNPYVDKVYTYIHSKSRQRNPRPGFIASLIDAWTLKHHLKREHFDWIVVCNGGFNKPSVRIAQALGGKIVSATREDGTFQYRVDYPITGLLREPIDHEIVRTFKLLEPLGISADALPQKLTLSPDPSALATQARLTSDQPRPKIAIHISARDPRREWPMAKFTELIKKIHQSVPAYFWIICAPNDEQRANALSQQLGDIQHLLVAPNTTEDLVASLSLADMVVCQEGGILHLAAGLQKPVVGLFENTPEKIRGWYPWGTSYRLVHHAQINGLIKDIPCQDVSNAVLDLYQDTIKL